MCNNIYDWLDSVTIEIPARSVLGVLAFFGFMVTQMIRANLYISIVGMVGNITWDETTKTSNESYFNTTDLPALEDRGTVSSPELGRFQWDESTRGLLFGAFYWCYWLTELPGGIMAQRWGGRKVLGTGVTVAGVFNAFVPWASKYHLGLVAAVRAIQGLALGVTWPAMHNLAGCWIPARERSKFMNVYHGAAIGTAFTYPICGFIMEDFGWESTFYMISAFNILWSAGCYFFLYDKPDKHPRISMKERIYLQQHLVGLSKRLGIKKQYATPWLKIFKSSAFWAVLVASQGVMWCSITLSMQIPSYLKQVLNFDLKMNGILSGVPELSKFGFGLCFSALMDHLLQHKVMSLTTVRKLSVVTCEYIPAALLLAFNFIDASESTTIAIVLLVLTSAFGGASSSGSLANVVDISPHFAGVILGIIKTLSLIPGILSPMVAGFLTAGDKLSGWNKVFSTTAVIHIVCCTIFLLFGSAEIQPWNRINESKDADNTLQELNVPLKSTVEEEVKT
ncbi:sialin-like [Hetaerina americana]|uniref:sialin-like n=1 Tax=Hetaerina americana TaxID=62018 RepID=UPI003A7F4F0D